MSGDVGVLDRRNVGHWLRWYRALTVSGGRDEHLDQSGYGPFRGVQLPLEHSLHLVVVVHYYFPGSISATENENRPYVDKRVAVTVS